MDKVVPLGRAVRFDREPISPNSKNCRQLLPLERMLRMHFLQRWFNLCELGVKARCS
jgi:hypothetical protein